jgi:prepilin-type N-terminal cleavage/methylation domain-containing protein
MRRHHSQAGFSLTELMVAMAIMLLISGAATTALLKMSTTQATIWNRTQMHSGIRGATEVLQQEVGQAGRIALGSGSVTLTVGSAVGTGPGAARTLNVSSSADMFIGEILTLDTGTSQESATITGIPSGTSVTVTPLPLKHTLLAHGVLAPVRALGGFHAGIVPTTTTNGSSASILKLFGDINADGNMVYIEYSITPACICTASCSPASTTGNLYRNSMAWNGPYTAATASQVLLSNITANPNGSQCFTYQPESVGGRTFVTDVAITLTVQTQVLDPVTKTYQKETKALLNVSPRNVFNTWELASLGYGDRVQPTPPSITSLLPGS